MRTRGEIQATLNAIKSSVEDMFIIELLLDIRDLLQEKK